MTCLKHPSPSIELQIRGESIQLLAEGALIWNKVSGGLLEKILIIADFHLGRTETFAQNGLYLPEQAEKEDLDRLVRTSQKEEVHSILFLGDLIHAKSGLTPTLEKEFIEALKKAVPLHRRKSIRLITGNHDRATVKNWPLEWNEILVNDEWEDGPFVFRHEPLRERSKKTESFVWSGHLHPCIVMQSRGDRLRLKTFVIHKSEGILPAFSQLAGGFNVPKRPGSRFYPIADGMIYPLT